MEMIDRSSRRRTIGSDDEEEDDEGQDDEDVEPRRSSTAHKTRRESGTLETSLLSSDEGDSQLDESERSKTMIPSNLISVLLQMHWNGDEGGNGKSKTRIQNDATKAVGKYIDTFVREAIARAAWMGSAEYGYENAGRGTAGGGGGDGVLEVEKLERLAPQLLLDF